MYRFLLDSLNFQTFHLHIKHLAQIHDNRFMDLLPQMGPEYLNQRDLQCGYLAMHEYTSQIKLHLETNVNVGPIDSRRPPQCETSIRNLIKTRSLSMRQFLIPHRLFKTTSFLPKQTFPSREVSTFEQCVLEYTLNTTQSLNHIGSIVVQIPQFAIMSLMSPPKWVLLENLKLFEILSNTPTLIIRQRQSILLEQCIDTRYTMIPTILQIIQCQSTILSLSLSSFQSILSPNTLRIFELTLPCMNVPIQVRNQLIFFMTHTSSIMSDTRIGLLTVA